jgi:hypothetical protein
MMVSPVRLPLALLALVSLTWSCQDGGPTALSVTLQLEGPAQCLRLTASGPGGASLSTDIPVESGAEVATRTFTAAVYPGGALGAGALSLWAQGFPGPCGGAPATQEARQEAAFSRGKVTAVSLALRLLDSDGDGSPDVEDCAPQDPSRRPGTGDEPGAQCSNGADDDCDGQVDDGCPCTAGATQPCHPLGLGFPGLDTGNCRAGIQDCQPDGGWGTCSGAVSPAPERCNGLDDDCNGAEDDAPADAGQPCNSGAKGVCAAGTFLCSGGGLICAPDAAPSAEACNGLDDDCDGEADEPFPDVGQSCTPGVGACARVGILQCQPDGGIACSVEAGLPSPEVCNAADDDCDGEVDEGIAGLGTLCSASLLACVNNGTIVCLPDGGTGCSAPVPLSTPELCNGKDDDCDGQLDEGYPGLGQACSNGMLGACVSYGTIACLPDGTAACNAAPGTPGTETCNGLDDDCNGQTDEGFGLGQSCTNGQVGACLRTATVVCSGDGTSGCGAGPVTPGTEACNGADDDCDGAVDNGFNVGQPCTVGQGSCARSGTWACNGQATSSCRAGGVDVVPGAPTREVCDGADNDCDGTADEQPECGGPRSDMAENAAATWAAGESVDDSPSPCGQRPSGRTQGPTTFYVAADTSNVLAGASTARTDYLNPGAAYVVGYYPAARSGAWDLRTTSGLTFQYRVSLPANITLQASPVSPYVLLCSAGGGYAYYYPGASLSNTQWTPFAIPLAGGNGWYRGATANYDASNVHSVEFQLDPTRGGNPGTVQMYLDDVRFY